MQPTSAAAQREGNPAVDVGKRTVLAEQERYVAEMKDMLANMEKWRRLLKDEDFKLQRIEELLKVANAELQKVENATDAPEMSHVIANIEQLQNDKATCLSRLGGYDEIINTIWDQIPAAARVRVVGEFTQASGLTVDANGKVELPGSPVSE
jgi:hypothetical protein